VPPPDVTALCDQLEAHVARGRLRGLGPVDLGPEGSLPDAELAARIVLADIGHWGYMERVRGRRVTRATWAHLAEQVRRLLGYGGLV
jgi:hypothetical protein